MEKEKQKKKRRKKEERKISSFLFSFLIIFVHFVSFCIPKSYNKIKTKKKKKSLRIEKRKKIKSGKPFLSLTNLWHFSCPP